MSPTFSFRRALMYSYQIEFFFRLLKDVRPDIKPVIQSAFERPFTGALRQEGLCADSMDGAEGDLIGMGPCHGQGRNQVIIDRWKKKLLWTIVVVSGLFLR